MKRLYLLGVVGAVVVGSAGAVLLMPAEAQAGEPYLDCLFDALSTYQNSTDDAITASSDVAESLGIDAGFQLMQTRIIQAGHMLNFQTSMCNAIWS